jgi:V-type H+-transporting ATPase subunit G
VRWRLKASGRARDDAPAPSPARTPPSSRAGASRRQLTPLLAGSIAELRKAEEAASVEVEKARKERLARMKLAKNEADKEIAAFRAEQDARLKQLQESQDKADGSLDVVTLHRQADAEMQVMAKDVAANADKVADMLIEVVTRVDMRIPEARKGVKAG